MSPIKTGILCAPVYDEAAVQAVRQQLAHGVAGVLILQDGYVSMQRNQVEERLRRWCDEEELDLIVTIGGTLPAPGPGSREIVPDATLAVAERQLPGVSEAMRAYAEEALPLAIIDRSQAVIRGRTLILNLPAGAEVATRFLEAVLETIATIVALLGDEPPFTVLDQNLEGSRDEAMPDRAMPEDKPGAKGLNAEDFAAFLRRNQPPEA